MLALDVGVRPSLLMLRYKWYSPTLSVFLGYARAWVRELGGWDQERGTESQTHWRGIMGCCTVGIIVASHILRRANKIHGFCDVRE